MGDRALLERYAKSRDQEAFAELVREHMSMVHAAACRQTPQAAEDVAQAVFLLLAQKAGRVARSGALAGWLCQATRYCCANWKRQELRRRRHEQEAAAMAQEPSKDETWQKLLPLLDESLAKLSRAERDALVQRYLAGKSLQETAEELAITPDAVAQRASRGLEKLRVSFAKQGYSVPTAGVAGMLTAEGARIAPAGLGGKLVAVGIPGTVASGSVTAIAKGAIKMGIWLHAKLLAAAALLVVVAVTGMWMMARGASLGGGGSANLPPSASGSGATLPGATQPAIWVSLLVRSPLRSMADYHTAIATIPAPAAPLYRRILIPDCELEIRRAKDEARLVRIPRRDYLHEIKIGEEFRDWNFFDQADRRRIGNLPDGDYLIALCVGDARISNVAPLRIDAAFDATKAPALSAIPIEPGPGLEPRYLGLRGVAPAAGSQAGFDAAFYFPDVVIDGNRLVRPGPQTFIGPGPIPAGQQCETIIDLRLYAPELALDKPHTISVGLGPHGTAVGLGRYQSEKVELTAGRELGRAWDDATGKVAPPPEPLVVLAGKVTGPDGKPGKGYEVALGNNTPNPPRTETDDEGRYSFVNIPGGTYQLSCNSPTGQPQFTLDNVVFPVKEPVNEDFDMTSKCILAGNVTTPDGKPVAQMDVALTVRTTQGNAEFMNTTRTDGQGHYEIGSPLGKVTYLGINGQRVQGRMPILNPGQNQGDYVLRGSTARPAAPGRGG